MPDNAAVPLNRIERVLTTMIVSVTALSLISIVATLIGDNSGADMTTGIWPMLVLIGLIGLPIAFVLIAVFIIVVIQRRRRIAQDGER